MKKALITGASGGIGSAIARALASEGYLLMLQYHTNVAAAQALANEIQAGGGMAGIICADLASPEAVKAMCSEVTRQLGTVDLIVNNAGLSRRSLVQDIAEADWDEMLNVDLRSAFLVDKYLLPGMISRQRGCIIHVSSVIGVYGASYESSYAAAKGGLNALTKSMAKELGPSGIRVNAVAPGCIDTTMLAMLDAEERMELADRASLGRLGSPEDVANAVAFLASDKASFITGQILGVDGGFVL